MSTTDWIKWVVATVTAAVTITFAGIAYIDGAYYSKDAGTRVEVQVDRIADELSDIKGLLHKIEAKMGR